MAFRDYFQEDMYYRQNSAEMKDLQLRKLRERLKIFSESSPLVNMLIENTGIKPEEVTMEQYNAAVPVITQRDAGGSSSGSDIVGNRAALSGVNEQDFLLLCSTSGTTGEPSPYFLTEEDLQVTAHGLARAMWMISGESEEELRSFRAVQAFALSMVGAGMPMVETLIRLGIPVIPVGAEGGTERIVYFTQKLRGNLLFSTPSLAEHMAEVEPQKVKDLGFKRIVCGAEPGAGVIEVKKKMEADYGCPVVDAMGLLWGMAWVSCDHPEYGGMHFLADDFHIIQLVDPETQENIPFEDGAVGQLVLVPLVGSLPPMRATPGDSVQVFTQPCKCGVPGWRMKVVGRTDDMLKVKGVVVFPAAIDGVIAGFVPQVTGEFRITLDSPPPKVEPPLKLKVEYGENVKEERLQELAGEIAEEMHNRLKIRPQITWVKPMSLERSTYKTNFIEKNYE